MCVGCRDRAGKSELLRLVWRAPEVRLDPRQREPGRGAYLHPTLQCLDTAVRRRAVGRALRVPGADNALASIRIVLAGSGPADS